jgi:multimeric flavodoxin WrbA
MKVVCLLGSPRPKGNSATLAKRFCATAEKAGATVETFHLNQLHYKGCQGCMACKTKLDRCILKDDLTQVLDSVRDADALVMVTPVYFGDMTSQLKGFMDRTYSYLVPDFHTNPNPSRLPSGKKLVFIQVQGQPDEKQYADVFPRIERFFQRFGFTDQHLLRVCGVRAPDDLAKKEEALKKAEELALKITS